VLEGWGGGRRLWGACAADYWVDCFVLFLLLDSFVVVVLLEEFVVLGCKTVLTASMSRMFALGYF
jgi:hypothetical protein